MAKRVGHYAAILVTTHISNFKRATAIAAVLLVSLGLSACNGGQAWIASIDGKKISADRFAAGVKYYSELRFPDGPTTPEEKSAQQKGIVPTNIASEYAVFQVKLVFYNRLAKQKGVAPTDAEIEKLRVELTKSEGGKAFGEMPKWFQMQFATSFAASEAIVAYYAKNVDRTARAKQAYDQYKTQLTKFCIDFIALEDRASADAAHKRIAGGEDFAAVAKDVATERIPAAGDKADGDLGCQPATAINQNLGGEIFSAMAAAKDDELLDVAESQGVFYVLRLRNREIPAFETVKDDIIASLPTAGQQEADDAMNKLMKASRIEINPKYGTWSRDTGLVPPVGAIKPAGSQDQAISIAPPG